MANQRCAPASGSKVAAVAQHRPTRRGHENMTRRESLERLKLEEEEEEDRCVGDEEVMRDVCFHITKKTKNNFLIYVSFIHVVNNKQQHCDDSFSSCFCAAPLTADVFNTFLFVVV